MKSKKACILVLCLVILISVFGGCGQQKRENSIDVSVLPAWTGKYSKDARAEAIKRYAQTYVPVYAMNITGDSVTFTLDFEAVSCGNVVLAPVDDMVKDGELNTIVDFSTDASVSGKEVTVDISWWYRAAASARSYTQWSYLFWISDGDGTYHYFYFRVDYRQ